MLIKTTIHMIYTCTFVIYMVSLCVHTYTDTYTHAFDYCISCIYWIIYTVFHLFLQVFVIPLERCSNYTTCNECASSRDPLCGWCSLGQYCSPSIDCSSSSHAGHWVDNKEQCIMSVSLTSTSMAVDFIQSVSLEWLWCLWFVQLTNCQSLYWRMPTHGIDKS